MELIIQNNETGTVYDISQLVSNVQWVTNLENQPGNLTFNIISVPSVQLYEGCALMLKVNGKGVFYGYIFKLTNNETNTISVIAYDQMRYLKNKDTYVIQNQTTDQVFSKVCTDFNLIFTVNKKSSYIVPPYISDNKTLFETIQYTIDQTLINTGEWFMIRDNYGTIEMNNLTDLKTDLFIGDKSLLNGFTYESSIDEDTYNQVKLIKDNKDTAKREVYQVFDSANIKRWGTLQYFEKMDEKANVAQIKARAEMILKLKNRKTKKFKMSCIGDLRVFAGAGVIVGISDIEELKTPKYYIVTSCTHSFDNNLHTMSLELKVSA